MLVKSVKSTSLIGLGSLILFLKPQEYQHGQDHQFGIISVNQVPVFIKVGRVCESGQESRLNDILKDSSISKICKVYKSDWNL